MPGESARINGRRGGRPKGTTGIRWKSTIDKEIYRETFRQLVAAEFEPLIRKQIKHAQGIDHFFLRNKKTKQFEQVKDPVLIEAALNSGDEGSYYWIFTKDPSVQAFTDLMNRTLDKPKEQAQEVNVQVSVNVAEVLRRRQAKLLPTIETKALHP